jgi:hypothetical protein
VTPWLYLGVIVAAVVGFQVFLAGVKAEARAACDAIHAEAARLGEKRARERTSVAAGKHEANRAAVAARERAIAPEVARVAADPAMAGTCLSDDSLRILADDVSQHGIAGEPARAVSPTASAPAR